MSSVGASERSRQYDEVRQTREEYENKEAEQAKKHKKEVKRLTERHDKEIQEIKDTYETQFKEIHEKNKDRFSEKDRENQAKVEKLRSMYLDQMRRKIQDHEEGKRALTDSYENQIDKERNISSLQKDLLKKNFDNSIQERDEQFKEFTTRAKEEVKEGLAERAERLNAKHKKELDVVTKDRDSQVGQAALNMKNVRDTFEGRIKNAQREHEVQKNRIQNHWMDKLDEEEASNRTDHDGMVAALKTAKIQLTDDYKENLEKKMESLDKAHETFKDQTTERIDDQLRVAKDDVHRLKVQRNIEGVANQRTNDLEKRHLVRGYEERMKEVNDREEGLRQSVNEEARERILDNYGKTQIMLQEHGRRFRTDQTLAREKLREERQTTAKSHQEEVDHLSQRSDKRISNLMRETVLAQKNQQKTYKENLENLKSSYSNHLANQREAQFETMKETYGRLDQRLKNTEDKYEKKLDDTVSNYESKLEQVEQFYRKELKRQEEITEQRIKSQEKAHELEQKTQDSKFETKMAQMQEAHDKEVDRLERRHQEQMAALSSRMNYLKKGRS